MRCKNKQCFLKRQRNPVFLFERIQKRRTFSMMCARFPALRNLDYKFGLILLHSEMAGVMFSSTSSSRILQRCS